MLSLLEYEDIRLVIFRSLATITFATWRSYECPLEA